MRLNAENDASGLGWTQYVASAIAMTLLLGLFAAPSLADANPELATIKPVPPIDAKIARLNNVLSTSPDVPAFAAQIPLDQTVELFGTVVSANGKPAAGADVWAAAVYTDVPHRERTRTDKQGRFRLHLEPLRGSAYWSVSAFLNDEGGEANDINGTVEVRRSKPVKPIDIRLQNRGRVSGRVWSEEPGLPSQKNGMPLADARMYLDDGRIIVSDAEGRYEIRGLKQENHRATFVCAGRERKRICFDTTGQAHALLDIRLARGGTVRGRVLDNADKPVPRAAVSIPGSGHPLALDGRTTITADDGTFIYDGVAYDSTVFGMLVEAPGYGSDSCDSFLVSVGEDQKDFLFRLEKVAAVPEPDPPITLLWNDETEKRGGIRGRVVDPGGRPVRDFRILLSPYRAGDGPRGPDEKWGGYSVEFSVLGNYFTNEKGEFTLTNIDLGHMNRVIAEVPGYGHGEVDRVVSQPLDKIGESPQIVLKLTTPHALTINVRDATGAPVPNASILFATEEPTTDTRFHWDFDDWGWHHHYTDANGRLAVSVPFREATVVVRAAGRARQRFGWRNGEKEFTVRLEPESTIEASIQMSDGRPFADPDANVQLESDSGDTYNTSMPRETPDSFQFRELPAGKYKLSLRGRRGQLHEQSLELAKGEHQKLSIHLPATYPDSRDPRRVKEVIVPSKK